MQLNDSNRPTSLTKKQPAVSGGYFFKIRFLLFTKTSSADKLTKANAASSNPTSRKVISNIAKLVRVIPANTKAEKAAA